jgi:signal transduction histidine kinase
MREWLRGKRGGLAAFVVIAGLVAGGLGWATAAALRLEQEQLDQRARAEQENRAAQALSRLDLLVSPHLFNEDNRPFDHYSAVYAPAVAFKSRIWNCYSAGEVVEPSPLLNAELPAWMCLHFQAEEATTNRSLLAGDSWSLAAAAQCRQALAPGLAGYVLGVAERMITSPTDDVGGWASPQVLSSVLTYRLRKQTAPSQWPNLTPERKQLLVRLGKELPAKDLLAIVRERAASVRSRATTVLMIQPGSGPVRQSDEVQQQAAMSNAQSPLEPQSKEYLARNATLDKVFTQKPPQRIQRDVANYNTGDNGAQWLRGGPDDPGDRSVEVLVALTPMMPVWLPPGPEGDRLIYVRLVRVADREVCQGVVLDVPLLEKQLKDLIVDLFPEARLLPMRDRMTSRPERTMAALPFQLDLGEPTPVGIAAGWTALRVGLLFAWIAAGVALLAVALGGWSLLDLSERRIRFVSAVTHELRTPLTTLRLYLDMLLDGLVREEGQREEYLRTLHSEADRLNRLVGNVLDFSRLERQRPQLNRAQVSLSDLLVRLRGTWEARARTAGKELVFENNLPPATTVWTDGALLEQVLGNLIDNACKYSVGAEDHRVWVRVGCVGQRWVFEVEDRGPGVPARERRAIFRVFRRGRCADVTAGGVGLGLALARRWACLLGGRLQLVEPSEGAGACFRVTLPTLTGPTPERP